MKFKHLQKMRFRQMIKAAAKQQNAIHKGSKTSLSPRTNEILTAIKCFA